MQRTTTATIQQSRISATSVVPALTAALAIGAGVIHLAHNYLPMQAPTSASGGPPPGAASATGGATGLIELVMPHLSQIMVLNFVAFVGLAIVLVTIVRLRSQLRVVADIALAALSLATLYAWNAMGRANPSGTGTMALVVELALVVIALGDAAFVALSRTASARFAARST
jgi:hypothetical protein